MKTEFGKSYTISIMRDVNTYIEPNTSTETYFKTWYEGSYKYVQNMNTGETRKYLNR